jgi:hypothetical protein
VALYSAESESSFFILAHGIHQTTISILEHSSGAESRRISPAEINVVSTNSIQIPSGFDITTFLPDPERGIFFLGSRQGALACYELSSAQLVGLWRRIHDHEGVRSIRLHHANKLSSSYTEIITAGRNCAYRILGISVPGAFKEYLSADIASGSVDGVQLHQIHKNILNRGWLEGVYTLYSSLTVVCNGSLKSLSLGILRQPIQSVE